MVKYSENDWTISLTAILHDTGIEELKSKPDRIIVRGGLNNKRMRNEIKWIMQTKKTIKARGL